MRVESQMEGVTGREGSRFREWLQNAVRATARRSERLPARGPRRADRVQDRVGAIATRGAQRRPAPGNWEPGVYTDIPQWPALRGKVLTDW